MADQMKLDEMFQYIALNNGRVFGIVRGNDQIYRIGDMFFSINITEKKISDKWKDREVSVSYRNRNNQSMGTLNDCVAKNIEAICNIKYMDQVICSLEKYKRGMRLGHTQMQMKGEPEKAQEKEVRHIFTSNKYRIIYIEKIKGLTGSIEKLTASSLQGGESVDFTGINAMKIAMVCEKDLAR